MFNIIARFLRNDILNVYSIIMFIDFNVVSAIVFYVNIIECDHYFVNTMSLGNCIFCTVAINIIYTEKNTFLIH